MIEAAKSMGRMQVVEAGTPAKCTDAKMKERLVCIEITILWCG